MEKKKIMVVDDSRFIFEEIKFKLLSSEKYEAAYYCPDGESLLESYEKYKPDLVTMDIVMPGIDGIEATRILKEKYPDAKVIMVTSMVFDDTEEGAQKAGACGFLAKPFESKEMEKVFDKAFAS